MLVPYRLTAISKRFNPDWPPTQFFIKSTKFRKLLRYWAKSKPYRSEACSNYLTAYVSSFDTAAIGKRGVGSRDPPRSIAHETQTIPYRMTVTPNKKHFPLKLSKESRKHCLLTVQSRARRNFSLLNKFFFIKENTNLWLQWTKTLSTKGLADLDFVLSILSFEVLKQIP